MEALTSVNVAHNKITRLPAEIGELANLTDVDMYAPFPCAAQQCRCALVGAAPYVLPWPKLPAACTHAGACWGHVHGCAYG